MKRLAESSSGSPRLELLEPRLLLSTWAPYVAAAAAPPVITGLTGKYDGNPAADVVGRYIAGVSVAEKFGAKLTGTSWSDPVVAVTFQLGDRTFTDKTSWDGWGFSFNVGSLTETTSLIVTARTKSGQVSNAYEGEVQIIAKPQWITDLGGTVSFSTTAKAYTLHAKEAVLQKSVTVPVDCPIMNGKYSTADMSLTIDVTVPTAATGAVRSKITGSLVVNSLGKLQVSKTWTATATPSATAPFNAAMTVDANTLEISSLTASLDYGTTSRVSGSLANCPVAAFLGVTGNLVMNTTTAVDAACHYDIGTGLVVDGGSTLDVNTIATLSSGTLNTVRASNVPQILQWGLSGSVNGTITQGLHATVEDGEAPQWTAPFSSDITCTLKANSVITAYLQNILRWDMSKPIHVVYSADLVTLGL
jgi:hypothetical protein